MTLFANRVSKLIFYMTVMLSSSMTLFSMTDLDSICCDALIEKKTQYDRIQEVSVLEAQYVFYNDNLLVLNALILVQGVVGSEDRWNLVGVYRWPLARLLAHRKWNTIPYFSKCDIMENELVELDALREFKSKPTESEIEGFKRDIKWGDSVSGKVLAESKRISYCSTSRK